MTLRTPPSERWARSYAGDRLIADTRRPLLFWEDRFPVPSYAVPEADVRMDLLNPGEVPTPAVGAIRDHVAFYNEVVDTTVDGVLEPRPHSPFGGDRP